MDEHVLNWLGAYSDGELQPTLENRVRDHLTICAECRHELVSLENLSGLLRSQPVSTLDPARAASRLIAQLPDREEPTASHSSKGTIWWFIPILVVIITLILQIAMSMTLFMLLTDWAGLGGLAKLFPGLTHTTASSQSWSSLLDLGMQGDPLAVLSLLDSVRQSVDFLFAGITGQLALALIYIAWLVVAWNKRFSLLVQSPKQMDNYSVSIGV
jgi:predicted anti-sigma-YlaC factor YlaD